VYIYINNKLEHEKYRYNPAFFYKKYLEDGKTDEENKEPYSSREEDENKNQYMREERTHMEVKSTFVETSGLDWSPHSPILHEGNIETCMWVMMMRSVLHRWSPNVEDPHISVWNAFPIIVPHPTRAKTRDANNEGINIPIPMEAEPIRFPLPTHLSSSMPMNLHSAA